MSDLSQLTSGTWNIDPSHSTVGFTVRHLMISKVRGRFGTFSGSLTIGADPLQSSVQATVDLASVEHRRRRPRRAPARRRFLQH